MSVFTTFLFYTGTRYTIHPSGLSGFLRCQAMFMPSRVLRYMVFKLASVPLNMPVSSLRLANHDVRLWSERGNASDSYRRKHPIKEEEEDFGEDDVDAQIEAVIR